MRPSSALCNRPHEFVEHEAKAEIGHYQDAAGPFGDWPELAPSTRAEEQRLGRTGDLPNSIEHTVMGDEAHVGSNSEIAAYLELGTAHIPPRSFLGGALVRKEDEVVAIVGSAVVGALIGREPVGKRPVIGPEAKTIP